MNYLTRLVAYSVLLLLVFLAAAIGAQAWLRLQTRHLRADAIEAKRAQFLAATRAFAPANGPWETGENERLGAVIGGTVFVLTSAMPAPANDPALLYFDQPLGTAGATPLTAHVTFGASPMTRLLAMYQRVTVAVLVFGFALVAIGAFFAALHWRGAAPEPESAGARGIVRAEVGSLAQLAESSVAQNVALTRERGERRLAQEDSALKQQLLNQSLEGKVRLGHDLHDGIIQALYAAGLTIESARSAASTNPAQADRLLAQCVKNLNATIRDVRAYITGLAPNHLQQVGFARAIEALVEELGAGRAVKLDLKIDDEAAAALSPAQSIEALQIAREAISNSLRHGGASFVTVRLHQIDREVCLLVQDNGTGFDSENLASSGFGLGNMQARASRIGGHVRVDSQPTAGTRVVLTLPLAPVS